MIEIKVIIKFPEVKNFINLIKSRIKKYFNYEELNLSPAEFNQLLNDYIIRRK